VKPRCPAAQSRGRSFARPTAGRPCATRRSSPPRRAPAHSARCGVGVNRLPTQPARRPGTGRPRSAPTGARFRTPALPELSVRPQGPVEPRGTYARSSNRRNHPEVRRSQDQDQTRPVKHVLTPSRMSGTDGVQHVLNLYTDTRPAFGSSGTELPGRGKNCETARRPRTPCPVSPARLPSGGTPRPQQSVRRLRLAVGKSDVVGPRRKLDVVEGPGIAGAPRNSTTRYSRRRRRRAG
jgi:hypothetical protein